MLLLVADENFNNDILRGLLRRDPSLDILRIQDVGLTHAPDPVVLEWAAKQNRVLLTHDRNTITKFAYQRVLEGKSMPGVIEVNRSVPMSVAIDDIFFCWQYRATAEIGKAKSSICHCDRLCISLPSRPL